MKKEFYSFIKSHNLVNRIYDMVEYFGIIKDSQNETVIKRFFKERLENIEYIETLADFFEKKLEKCNKNVELRCNLVDLIYDLDFLKQYF